MQISLLWMQKVTDGSWLQSPPCGWLDVNVCRQLPNAPSTPPWVVFHLHHHLFFNLSLKAKKVHFSEKSLHPLPNKPDWLLVTRWVASLLLSLQILAVIHLKLTRTRAMAKSYLSESPEIELLMKPCSVLRDLEDCRERRLSLPQCRRDIKDTDVC